MLSVRGQNKYDYTWIAGTDNSNVSLGTEATLIDFGVVPPVLTYQGTSSPQSLLALGEICDRNTGRLMFYSNGCVVFDSTHHIMANGDSINFGSFWKSYCVGDKYLYYPNVFSVIALPDLNFEDQYYLLHQVESYLVDKIVNQPLMYSKIFFEESNPRGKVLEKNVPFYNQNTTSGFFTAMKHANKKDWWIMHLEARSNKYLKFLLDSTGIHLDHSQVIGDSIRGHHAQSQFSPDGKKYAWFNKETGLHLFDFDRTTGVLSNYRSLTIEAQPSIGGLCFSPNSRFLYVFDITNAYQVDLSVPDLKDGYVKIGSYNPGSESSPYKDLMFGMLGPNCKIYISSKLGSSHFSTIESPDEKGAACNFQALGLKLIYSSGGGGVPNLPHYRVDDPYPCDRTLGNVWNLPEIEEMLISPNPVSDQIVIKTKAKGLLSVYDMSGRSCYQRLEEGEKEVEIDVSAYAPGKYVLIFEERHRVYKGEFIKG
ncbi:MAG: T9SS type A sorting domain-containing protein [Saprospiraceae bacterium]|nr:T9SS type A sorting domain-containing protein [Saprospiraceae bacterium]